MDPFESRAAPRRFVALGDSITWGFPVGPVSSWVDLAARVSGVEIVNMGVNGDTLADMRRRLPLVLDQTPMACIVTGGTNDVSVGRTVADMIADLGEIISVLAGAGVVPVIGMPPPFLEARCERQLDAYRHFVNGIAATRHLRIVPFDRAFKGEDGALIDGLMADAAHPSDQGYAAMAALLLKSSILAMGKEAE